MHGILAVWRKRIRNPAIDRSECPCLRPVSSQRLIATGEPPTVCNIHESLQLKLIESAAIGSRQPDEFVGYFWRPRWHATPDRRHTRRNRTRTKSLLQNGEDFERRFASFARKDKQPSMSERAEARTLPALIGWIAATALLTVPEARVVARSPAIVQPVTPNAYAYVPAELTRTAPLVILLHGAGGDARNFIEQFKRQADERGVILLSIQSRGRTWAQRKPKDGEADVANIKAAIGGLAAKAPFEPGRTVVMGFSDGASYALSVGMAYPDLFRTIVAFSPGYAFAPPRLDTEQRIFISHSRRDPILPAENTRQMIKGLKSAGFAPEVHWFNGGHEIDPELKKAAFDFALSER